MLYIGCHLSSSKGFAAMGRQALELGANTFQFFTRNPRGSRAKDLDEADAAALRDLMAERAFGPIVAHAPYTLNLCGAEEHNRLFARETMADDLRRLEHLPGQLYNFHPGSHVGQGIETGIGLEALGRIVRHPALKHLPFCLETPNDLPGYAREIALMREIAEA